MNRKHKYYKIFFLLCLLISLVSCKSNSVGTKIDAYDTTAYKDMELGLENHMNYLTSKECDGRLLGTEGNVKAQNYIRYCLEQYSIIPYENLYNSTFSYSCTNFKELKVKLNGKELKKDVDYLIKSVLRYNEKFDISESINKDNTGKVVMFDEIDKDELIKFSYDNSFNVVLSKTDDFKNSVENKNNKIDWINIYLKTDIYDDIQNGDNFELKYEYENVNKTDNNIVGIIKSSQETTNAIVLSAHFDHVGSIDDKLYCGALDNASGTACLLDLAQKLSTSLDKSKLNCDIVFAFFNAEEGDLYGSKEFAKQIYQKYTNVIDINFDCVGGKEHDSITVDFANNQNMQFIYDEIVEQFENCKTDSFTSDHRNFTNGIGLLTYDSNGENVLENDSIKKIHTLLDTLDNIDMEFLKSIVDKFSTIITKLTTDEHTFCTFENHEAELQNVRSQGDLLDFGEYKYIDIGESIEVASKLRYESYDKAYVSGIVNQIMDGYNKLQFNYFNFNFSYNIIPQFSSEYELDTVYKIDYDTLSWNDINDIILHYNDNEKYIGISLVRFNDPVLREMDVEFFNSQQYTVINKSDIDYYYKSSDTDNKISYLIENNLNTYQISFHYCKYLNKENGTVVQQTSDEMFEFMEQYDINNLVNTIIKKIESQDNINLEPMN